MHFWFQSRVSPGCSCLPSMFKVLGSMPNSKRDGDRRMFYEAIHNKRTPRRPQLPWTVLSLCETLRPLWRTCHSETCTLFRFSTAPIHCLKETNGRKGSTSLLRVTEFQLGLNQLERNSSVRGWNLPCAQVGTRHRDLQMQECICTLNRSNAQPRLQLILLSNTALQSRASTEDYRTS